MHKKIKILLAASYLWFFGEGLLGPLYVIFAQRIGGDILEITGAYALYLIVTGMLSIAFGKLSDTHSKEKLMVLGYAINTLATFGYLLVDSPLKLFFIQALLGVAAALATPTWDSLFSEYVDRKKSGEQWGLSDGGPHIVTGVAIIFGGLIVTYFGFAALFILMGLFQVAATILQSLIIHSKSDG